MGKDDASAGYWGGNWRAVEAVPAEAAAEKQRKDKFVATANGFQKGLDQNKTGWEPSTTGERRMGRQTFDMASKYGSALGWDELRGAIRDIDDTYGARGDWAGGKSAIQKLLDNYGRDESGFSWSTDQKAKGKYSDSRADFTDDALTKMRDVYEGLQPKVLLGDQYLLPEEWIEAQGEHANEYYIDPDDPNTVLKRGRSDIDNFWANDADEILRQMGYDGVTDFRLRGTGKDYATLLSQPDKEWLTLELINDPELQKRYKDSEKYGGWDDINDILGLNPEDLEALLDEIIAEDRKTHYLKDAIDPNKFAGTFGNITELGNLAKYLVQSGMAWGDLSPEEMASTMQRYGLWDENGNKTSDYDAIQSALAWQLYQQLLESAGATGMLSKDYGNGDVFGREDIERMMQAFGSGLYSSEDSRKSSRRVDIDDLFADSGFTVDDLPSFITSNPYWNSDQNDNWTDEVPRWAFQKELGLDINPEDFGLDSSYVMEPWVALRVAQLLDSPIGDNEVSEDLTWYGSR